MDTLEATFLNRPEIWSECLSWYNLRRGQIPVTWDRKQGQFVILKKYIVGALKASFLAQSTWNLVRMFVLIRSEINLNLDLSGQYVILKKYLVGTVEATFHVQLTWKLVRMFVLLKSRMSF